MIISARKDKIVDKVNLNNFGVLFHTMKSMELFQEKSGMEGSYSNEYQHHYWCAVGRLEVDGQILDVGIPLVMVHYHQEVGGASVEFNLGEVGQASNASKQRAIKKLQELQETEFFNKVMEIGIKHWQIVPMNTFHAHPSGVNRFSGTDLRANIDHPGVCFPLSVGENIANFAGIIQHKEDFAQIIHNEYRVFNGTEAGERVYEKGRCLTIVKGYENEPLPEVAPVVDGIIDNLFGTSRPKPPPPPRRKERKSFVLKDGFSANQGDDFAEVFKKLWDECTFEVDTELVLESNVIVGRGRLQNTQYGKGWQPGNHAKNAVNEYNEGLFADGGYATHKNKKKKQISQVEREMVEALVEIGYDLDDLLDLNRKELDDLFESEIDGTVDAPDFDKLTDGGRSIMTSFLHERGGYTLVQMATWSLDAIQGTYNAFKEKVEEIEEAREPLNDNERKDFLVQYGYTLAQMYHWHTSIVQRTYNSVRARVEKEELEAAEEDANNERGIIITQQEVDDMVESLSNDNIISKQKLMVMSNDNIIKFYREVYGS